MKAFLHLDSHQVARSTCNHIWPFLAAILPIYFGINLYLEVDCFPDFDDFSDSALHFEQFWKMGFVSFQPSFRTPKVFRTYYTR